MIRFVPIALLAACTSGGESTGPIVAWTHVYDTPAGDFSEQIATADNGDALVAATSYGDGIARVMRFDRRNGGLIWEDDPEGSARATDIVPIEEGGFGALAVLDEGDTTAMWYREYTSEGEVTSTRIEQGLQGWQVATAPGGLVAVIGHINGNRFVRLWQGGTWVWEQVWAPEAGDQPVQVAVDADGNVTVAFWNEPLQDARIARFNSAGEALWYTDGVCGSTFAVAADGAVVAAGIRWEPEQAIRLCRIEADGTWAWEDERVVSWQDWIGITGLAIADDGQIALGGTAYEIEVPSVTFTRVYDEDGALLWKDRFTGTDGKFAYGGQVAWADDGGLYTTGVEWRDNYAMVVRKINP